MLLEDMKIFGVTMTFKSSTHFATAFP